MATEYQSIVARIRAYIEIYQPVMGCGGAGKGMKFSLTCFQRMLQESVAMSARMISDQQFSLWHVFFLYVGMGRFFQNWFVLLEDVATVVDRDPVTAGVRQRFPTAVLASRRTACAW